MNRVIVITGGSSGIGKQLIKEFTFSGDRVYMLARTNPENYAYYHKCDVTNEEQVKSALKKIGDKEERIDMLVNNAGIGISGATELLDSKEVQKVMDINFMGTFYCCKHALPYMKKGGRIINVSSVIALFSRPFHSIYCAAKSAVSMFSYGLYMELKPSGIDVCAICPTGIASDFSKNRIKTFDTNERYGDRVKDAYDSVENRSRMPVEECAKQIHKCAVKKRLKPMYIIGGSFKILNFFQKFLPLKVVLNQTNKMFGGLKKKKQ